MRRLHSVVALVLLLPLALSAATGLVYRVGRNWFGMSDETGKFVRGLHEGTFLGGAGVPIYVLLVGLGLLALIITGLGLFRADLAQARLTVPSRRVHRAVATLLALPLAASAVTGIAYRLAQSWFGWSEGDARWLMDIHQGTWLGLTGRAVYVIILGSGLLLLLFTGVLQWRARRRLQRSGVR